ncbi:MAG: cation transporter [Candidatus Odinarchaeota archaeon]
MSEENVTEKKIPVKGINCAKCRLDIENVLTRFKGVESAKMDYMTGNISVKYDYKKTDLPEIERVIENLGYNIAYKEYDTGLSKFKKLFGKKIKHLRKVDDHTFPGLVLETCKLTVLLVYEENCGECERIESELNSLIPVFKNKVYFYKADCKLSTICDRYDVKQLPSILFFKDHNLIET